MIFVTVGSMFPFERMIRMIDEWAFQHPTYELLAQIGGGRFEPRHMRWQRIIPPNEYKKVVAACQLIIAHAGTGSVFTASEFRKPIVLIPRRAAQREHTTDHQLDTAKWLQSKEGIFVSWSEDDLVQTIEQAQQAVRNPPSLIPLSAPPPFLQRIRSCLVTKCAK
jgi:UDP-N-acetylglucosamine transferase subunit ALG13